MLFSYSLSLDCQLLSLFSIFLDFIFNVLLIASLIEEAFSAALDVIIFFIQPLHFKFNELIFELIEFNFGIHGVDFVSELINNGFDLFDIVLDFGGYSQERLFFGLVLVLHCLELLQCLFFLLQFWSQSAFLFSYLFQKFLDLFVDLLN